MERASTRQYPFLSHGWLGLGLIALFWPLNWALSGPRTHWGFFPLWLGYCLAVDALVYMRKGTSLVTRSSRKYFSLFLISALVWWLFEAFNWRLQNWEYLGTELFSSFEFSAWATLSFTTVIPAVFGTAELVSTFDFMQRIKRGPVVRPDRRTTRLFFAVGWAMLVLLWAWPRLFFPFIWISVYFILEPVNVWLGNRSLAEYTRHGNWQPILALWIGVLTTGFFWEMGNYFAFPKWVYHIPWADCCHIFEMPLLGYGGYLPFALELYATYHLIAGFLGQKRSEYVWLEAD